MLRFVSLEQQSTTFTQAVDQGERSHRGSFPGPGTSQSCLHGEPRFISALQVALLLLVLPQQTQLFRAYKINGFRVSFSHHSLAACSFECRKVGGGERLPKVNAKNISL